MIYMNHNTASNFMNANGSGDSKMKRDILLSEIAKIIVGNPRLVVFHLRNSGFKVENNPSKSTLVTIVSNALNKSKKFATKMAHEILGNTYGATGDVAAGDTVTSPILSTAPPTTDPTTTSTTSTLTTNAPLPSEPMGTTTTTAPRTAPASTTPTKTVDVSTPPVATTTSAPNELVRPAPAGPPTIILPIVSSLGSIFGGAPTYGPSGGGGGGGGEASSAEADLRSKTNAITDLDGKMKKRKKIIGFSLLFIVLAGGTYYYYTHNK